MCNSKIIFRVVCKVLLLVLFSCSIKPKDGGLNLPLASGTLKQTPIICGTGMIPMDSITYIKGGADGFLPTEIISKMK